MPVVLLRRAVIHEAINRLVRDDRATLCGAQTPCDLLGRPALLESSTYMGPELEITRELEAAIPTSAPLGELFGPRRLIATAPRFARLAVALQLPADGAHAATQGTGNGAHRTACPMQTVQLDTFG